MPSTQVLPILSIYSYVFRVFMVHYTVLLKKLGEALFLCVFLSLPMRLVRTSVWDIVARSGSCSLSEKCLYFNFKCSRGDAQAKGCTCTLGCCLPEAVCDLSDKTDCQLKTDRQNLQEHCRPPRSDFVPVFLLKHFKDPAPLSPGLQCFRQEASTPLPLGPSGEFMFFSGSFRTFFFLSGL